MKVFVNIPLSTGKSALLNVDHIEGFFEQKDGFVAILSTNLPGEVITTSLNLEEIYDLIRKAQK